MTNYDPEYILLECFTCNVDFDIIVENQEQIDDCIKESGHEGHDFSLSGYAA